jgi:hypothetical protein
MELQMANRQINAKSKRLVLLSLYKDIAHIGDKAINGRVISTL